jgi:hypothetical protein
MKTIKFPRTETMDTQVLRRKEHRGVVAEVRDFFTKRENILTLSPAELRIVAGMIHRNGGRG